VSTSTQALLIVALLLGAAIAGVVGAAWLADPSGSFGFGGTSRGGAPLQVVSASLYASLVSSEASDAGVRVAVVSEGSLAGARQVLLDPQAYGLFVSADSAVVQSVLMPSGAATWYVALGSDRMVLSYRPGAPAAPELANLSARIVADRDDGNGADAVNATARVLDLVLEGNGKIGTTDPATDPEGYRALFVLELVGAQARGDSQHYLALLQSAQAAGRVVTEPSGKALVGVLQAGAVDYDIAIYGSTAQAAGLPTVALADSVDLGNASQAATYAHATATVHAPGGSNLTLAGAPVQMVATVPSAVGNGPSQAASLLLLHLVGASGHVGMVKVGVTPLSPALVYGNETALPQVLKDIDGSSLLAEAPP
jgi:molybdate/tungstate transport system substrate-binding protein